MLTELRAPEQGTKHLWNALARAELFREFARERSRFRGRDDAPIQSCSRRNGSRRHRLSDVDEFSLEDTMTIRLILLAAAVAAVPTFANAQSTTGQGAQEGARTGGQIGGPVGAIVGGTVGAAV